MAIVATWRPGYGLYKGVDAQTVAEEIMSIGDAATPQEIVDKARSEKTELHKCFEWDDSIAAEKYRIEQARDVVHHLIVKEQKVNPDRPPIRFFVKPEKSDGYKPVTYVVRKEDEYADLLERAWRELRAFKAKYSCLQELKEILDLID